ncbi:MAG TPA: RNA methyltransferase [Chloroflexota bacterium]|nr:RNA methyltransferase [Chloroflexota bacterium]HUM71056.1 RNA methyltransferase [Chloroflexota bacterium]
MESGRLVFQIRQCGNRGCRFRFPAVVGSGERCPQCGEVTAVVATPHTKRQTATPHPTSGLHLELLLDNIRSLYNVGSIFRTADGAGVKHMHLAGMSATPEHPKLAKTALGADSQMGWSYSRNGLDTAVRLQTEGFRLWALEDAPEAVSLYGVRGEMGEDGRPVLLVVGNENVGVDPAILQRCDQILAIPMLGVKDSLNVAVACGIAIYHLCFGANRDT